MLVFISISQIILCCHCVENLVEINRPFKVFFFFSFNVLFYVYLKLRIGTLFMNMFVASNSSRQAANLLVL